MKNNLNKRFNLVFSQRFFIFLKYENKKCNYGYVPYETIKFTIERNVIALIL